MIDIKTGLQKMRKAAGFRSAREFAEHIGLNVATYTNYEQGRNSITLSLACKFAHALGCTVDDIAGNPVKTRERFDDPRQAALNGYYESLNDESKTALVSFAKSFAADPERRIVKDRRDSSGASDLGAVG